METKLKEDTRKIICVVVLGAMVAYAACGCERQIATLETDGGDWQGRDVGGSGHADIGYVDGGDEADTADIGENGDDAAVCADGGLSDGAIVQNKAVMIAAGDLHACALTATGALKCWGGNDGYALGNHCVDRMTSSPIDPDGPFSDVRYVSAGDSATCAELGSHETWCWGVGTEGYFEKRPEPIPGLFGDVSEISLSISHGCALFKSGEIKCWGNNSAGQLGDGTHKASAEPVKVTVLKEKAVSMSAIGGSTCAVLESGTLQCWGEVGIASAKSYRSLAKGGGNHTCMITTTGGLECAGYNTDGELGDGTTKASDIPVQAIGLESGVVAVSAGGLNTCAITEGGKLYCWGDDTYCQIGKLAYCHRNSSTPVYLDDLFDYHGETVAVSVGYWFICALVKTGEVLCWGDNSMGQCGRGWTNPYTNRGEKVVGFGGTPGP